MKREDLSPELQKALSELELIRISAGNALDMVSLGYVSSDTPNVQELIRLAVVNIEYSIRDIRKLGVIDNSF